MRITLFSFFPALVIPAPFWYAYPLCRIIGSSKTITRYMYPAKQGYMAPGELCWVDIRDMP